MIKNFIKAGIKIALMFVLIFGLTASAKTYIIEGEIIELGSDMLGAPTNSQRFERSLIPETDSKYYLGTTTKAWLQATSDSFCLTGDSCITAWSAGSMTALPTGQIYVGNASNEATATSTIFINGSTGYVGIGTTTPAYKLDVYGNVRIDGDITADNLNVINWDTAYGWGDHAGLYDVLGQATSTLASHTSTYNHDNFLVTGGTLTSGNICQYDGAGIDCNITNNSSNWDTAYGWGDHSVEGYLTAYTETDPVWIASSTDYLKTATALTLFDVLGQATSTLSSHTTTYNHDNYNTAYGWGDHALAGYNLQSYASSTYVWASDWTTIDNYPTGCTNQFVRTIGDTLTCATVDISSDTNLVAGTNITLSGDTLNVDDAFLLNNGDVGTGDYDFGGASFLEIPNGTNPTANDPGEIAHDTTDNQLILDDKVIRTDELIGAVTIASTSLFFSNIDLPVPPEKDGYTVTRMACYVSGGTSVQVTLTDGTNAMDTLTCGTSITADDGSIANSSVTANELMKLDPGTVSGAVNFVSFSWYGTYTRE